MLREKGQNIQPYCDIPFEQKCDSYENGIGTCALCKHENQLNESNQYADDSFAFTDIEKEKYGGYPFLDYCPVLLNDLMTPYQLESSCVSRITLAYFEDINANHCVRIIVQNKIKSNRANHFLVTVEGEIHLLDLID
ncbi:unnamed protein product [Schistosoma rodhaini]|nr:unnamed protein product [Schistosoma rodhaini]